MGMESRKIIAKNIAKMLHDGDFVNLGVGMPTLVSNYIPEDMTVLFHAENGAVGLGTLVPGTEEELRVWEKENSGEHGGWQTGHKDLCNASCEYVTLIPGSSCFDSSLAFIMARGGHLDATILGGMQVDAKGNLANWMIPGKHISGMGGAMDLVCGAKKVIVAMEHCTKTGESKLLEECTMPLTAVQCVDTVVTEYCILEWREDHFVVTAIAPYITKEELIAKTEFELIFADEITVMDVQI